MDKEGVALAAILGLHQTVEAKDEKISELSETVQQQSDLIAELTERLERLETMVAPANRD